MSSTCEVRIAKRLGFPRGRGKDDHHKTFKNSLKAVLKAVSLSLLWHIQKCRAFVITSLSRAASFLVVLPLVGRVTALNPQQQSWWLVNSPLLSGNLALESLREA